MPNRDLQQPIPTRRQLSPRVSASDLRRPIPPPATRSTSLARTARSFYDAPTIELIEPPDLPPRIGIRWTENQRSPGLWGTPTVAAGILSTFAAAVTELAAIRVWTSC